ncbi:MAG: transcriptional regulator GcvA [Parvularculaceae bacterium]|nr:transcriptional regulator GcvA [Parvularculaceae bacterium]
MARRLPPLVSLRVFESVARHLSFTKAADDLHVTQAAVSHQIKNLEEWLSIPLFLRLNRTIKLTKEGEAYATALTGAFEAIADATDAILKDTGQQAINIATFDSIAANWLAPRIKKFQSRHPEMAIKILTHSAYSDFADGDIDVEIRYGAGDWPNLYVVKIADEDIFPVCSPKLLGRRKRPLNVADLDEYSLIHDELVMEWSDWIEAAGGTSAKADKGMRYNHSHIVIRAAAAGEGMALGRSLLVADDIAAGRLVAPFEHKMPSKYSYYLVRPREHAEKAWAKSFEEWLLLEAAETMAQFN